MFSFVQFANRKMSLRLAPLEYNADVAAPLTLCALNILVSIPESFNTSLIHLASVEVEISLYGFTYDIKTFEDCFVSVQYDASIHQELIWDKGLHSQVKLV